MIASNPMAAACPYRVGDYLFTENSTSPATSWPGTTWEEVQGRFLLGRDASHPAGSTGGSSTHEHAFAIRYSEYYGALSGQAQTGMVSAVRWSDGTESNVGVAPSFAECTVNSGMEELTKDAFNVSRFQSNGSTQNVEAVPPYRAVYIYRRTA